MSHLLVILGACLACPVVVSAQSVVTFSPDVDSAFAGRPVGDEEVVQVTSAGQLARLDLGGLPSHLEVTGVAIASNGDALFALGTTSTLQPGGLVAGPRDVIRWDRNSYSIEFDGAARGVPAGACIDALSLDASSLVLSFDITVDLDGTIYADEDLVLVGTSSFSLYFDGSAAGLPANVDLDGAHIDGSAGTLLLSLDTAGSIGSFDFADEDVLEYDIGGSTWSLYHDGSMTDAAWYAADLDALIVGANLPVPVGAAVCLVLLAAAGFGFCRDSRRVRPMER